jgi:hypothetical protein
LELTVFSWMNNISDKRIDRDIHVADFDRSLVCELLEHGAIVTLTISGEFAFASHTLERAIRCASNGDLLIYPDGKTFYCGSSMAD